MKMKTAARRLCAALFSSTLTFLAPSAHAMSSTDQVAWKGKPVSETPGWPEGTLALINDPLRTYGWNPWFSECANDVNWYEFKIRDTEEVNHLIKKLVAIKATKVTIQFEAGKSAPEIGSVPASSQSNRVAVVFSVGNQKRLTEWYQQLKEVEPGVRGFGVWRYTNAPTALPPTLTIYAGHEAIDIKRLKIPPNVEVSGDCFKNFESITNGMTRGEVEKKLTMDGGLTGVSPVRFIDPKCPGFKINVEFDFKKDAADQGRAIMGRDDKVIHVSKPYLERPFMD